MTRTQPYTSPDVSCIIWCALSGLLVSLLSLLLTGCVAAQADLKSTERRIKQLSDELVQRGAQQRQELEELKGQELPRLRGELERTLHQAQELQGKQEDLKQRSAVLEQQTKRLEQLAGRLDAESTNRYAQVRESLNAQDVKYKADRDQLRNEVDVVLGTILLRIEALEKRLQDLEKR